MKPRQCDAGIEKLFISLYVERECSERLHRQPLPVDVREKPPIRKSSFGQFRKELCNFAHMVEV